LVEATGLSNYKVVGILENAYRAGLVDYRRIPKRGRVYRLTELGKNAAEQPPPPEAKHWLRKLLRPVLPSPGMR
jgi:DNA-binding MarR family transcriptional regulator